MGHAKLPPSGAERWMGCPGSVVLEEGCADSTSDYADEGTAAHSLAAMCLTEGKDAQVFKGRRMVVVNGVYWPGAPEPVPPKLKGHREEIKNVFEVDEDMIEPVQRYIDSIRQYAKDATLFVEQRLDISHLTGEEDAGGTGDAVIFSTDGELQVHDLKFGRGKSVSPVKNKQLMTYALAALLVAEMIDFEVKSIRLVIHQPRIVDGPQEWPLSLEELLAFGKEIETAVTRVDAAVKYAVDFPSEPLHSKYFLVSDETCRWCKAKATCDAAANFVEAKLEVGFEVVPHLAPEAVAFNVGSSGNKLGERLDAVDIIEDWCKAIRAEVERRLLSGEAVSSPKGGYKLVRGKKGHRKWIDPEAVEAFLKKKRLKIEHMYDFKLISPTSAEKLVKAEVVKEAWWKELQAEIIQSEGKAHVAPTSDPRPVLTVAAPDEGFAVVLPGGPPEMRVASIEAAVSADDLC